MSRGDPGRGRCGPINSQIIERRNPLTIRPVKTPASPPDCPSGREEIGNTAPRLRFFPRLEAAKECFRYPRTSSARPIRRTQTSRPRTSISSNKPGTAADTRCGEAQRMHEIAELSAALPRRSCAPPAPASRDRRRGAAPTPARSPAASRRSPASSASSPSPPRRTSGPRRTSRPSRGSRGRRRPARASDR